MDVVVPDSMERGIQHDTSKTVVVVDWPVARFSCLLGECFCDPLEISFA